MVLESGKLNRKQAVAEVVLVARAIMQTLLDKVVKAELELANTEIGLALQHLVILCFMQVAVAEGLTVKQALVV
jgi:hypothetical protein